MPDLIGVNVYILKMEKYGTILQYHGFGECKIFFVRYWSDENIKVEEWFHPEEVQVI